MQRRSFLGLLVFVPFIGKVSWFKNAEFEREVAWVWSRVRCLAHGRWSALYVDSVYWHPRACSIRPDFIPERYGNTFALYSSFGQGIFESENKASYERAKERMDGFIRDAVKAFKPVDLVWSNSFRSNVPNTLNKNRLAV